MSTHTYIWIDKRQVKEAESLLPILYINSHKHLHICRLVNTGRILNSLHKIKDSNLICVELNPHKGIKPILYGFNEQGQRNLYQLSTPTVMPMEYYNMNFAEQISEKQFDNLALHKLMQIADPSSL